MSEIGQSSGRAGYGASLEGMVCSILVSIFLCNTVSSGHIATIPVTSGPCQIKLIPVRIGMTILIYALN